MILHADKRPRSALLCRDSLYDTVRRLESARVMWSVFPITYFLSRRYSTAILCIFVLYCHFCNKIDCLCTAIVHAHFLRLCLFSGHLYILYLNQPTLLLLHLVCLAAPRLLLQFSISVTTQNTNTLLENCIVHYD